VAPAVDHGQADDVAEDTAAPGPEAVTALPAEFYDGLVASLDDPPVPNGPTRDAFQRLRETVRQQPADTEDSAV
jgi:hypothetical protein